jgi:hypothetical protein
MRYTRPVSSKCSVFTALVWRPRQLDLGVDLKLADATPVEAACGMAVLTKLLVGRRCRGE